MNKRGVQNSTLMQPAPAPAPTGVTQISAAPINVPVPAPETLHDDPAQATLPGFERPKNKLSSNQLREQDAAAHRWYRFVLSFPPHLVQHYLRRFDIAPGQRVLDPFCGTGTTLVECKKRGIFSVGMEAMPMAHFASCVKTDWSAHPDLLMEFAARVAQTAERLLTPLPEPAQYHRLPPDAERLLITGSISPLPLHRTLALMEALQKNNARRNGMFQNHARLALAKTVVCDAGNLSFGPEVGVGTKKEDAPVVAAWLQRMREMAEDLRNLPHTDGECAPAFLADARRPPGMIAPASVDAVITSPPYPNEKDYSRTTRLETVLLGFARNMEELRAVKKCLVRSNTRSVYKEDKDDRWVAKNAELQQIAAEIERRRLERKKNSGFEKNYARVTLQYFGGMARHLQEIKRVLKPGARLAYVAGDQASYLRVMIRTGKILADIAESLGYEIIARDLFRTRLATATGEQLREEALVLRWPGRASRRRKTSTPPPPPPPPSATGLSVPGRVN